MTAVTPATPATPMTPATPATPMTPATPATPMTPATPVFAEVRVLMAETLRIPAADIHRDGSFDDLQVDSLAMAELCVVLENSYGGQVDGDRLARARTVDELVTLVEKGLGR